MILSFVLESNAKKYTSKYGICGVLGLLLGIILINLIVLLLQWCWGLRFNQIKWASVKNKNEETIYDNFSSV
jgi:hypothetical protein